MTASSPYVAGDAIPGLLDDWCGPAEYERWTGAGCDNRCIAVILGTTVNGCPEIWYAGNRIHAGYVNPQYLRLDTRRPEVDDRARRVLAGVFGMDPDLAVFRWAPARSGWFLTDGAIMVVFAPRLLHADHSFVLPNLPGPEDRPGALAAVARWVGAELAAGRLADRRTP